MKNLLDYIDEEMAGGSGMAGSGLCSTPGNTMGMGNPMPAGVAGEKGSEGLPTAKAKKEKLRKKNKKYLKGDVNEAMKFPLKNFLSELYQLMSRYQVTLVQDEEGAYFEDMHKNVIFDFTDSYTTPDTIKKIAVKEK